MSDDPPSRRTFLRATWAALLSSAAPAWGSAPVPVEDWTAPSSPSTGVPPGWQKYETPGGRPAYEFTIVDHAGRRALHMKSASEHSTIAKEVRADLTAAPVLAWQWRVISLPRGADLQTRATSDATGHIFAAWPRFPAFARSRLIGYIWDPALPVGTVIPSRKTATVTFIVVRRGEAGLGQWLDERRNVAEDYRNVFGEAAPPLAVVALSIDTNDTGSTAEAMFGRIELRSR
ncbi:MAG TPA: DUF3047 domain-containing protein [Methylomirabilota bacterium]|nr:DUF3047 domain-containing protein [Methylomirabilota bacterium]